MKLYKILFLLLFGSCFSGFAQKIPKKKSKDSIQIDTVKILSSEDNEKNTYRVFSEFTEAGLNENLDKYSNNFLIRKQNELFNAIDFEIQNAENTIKKGIDYKGFTKELEYEIEIKKVALVGLFENDSRYLTYRNLTVTSLLLNEISNRIESQLVKINGNNKALGGIQNKIDSLFTSKELYLSPVDSVSKMIYFNRFMTVDNNYKSLHLRLKNALDSIHKLQILGTKFKYSVESDIIEVENLRKAEVNDLFFKHESLFKKGSNSLNFKSNLVYSFKKETLLVLFYIFNHELIFGMLLLTILAIWLYLNVLKRKYIKSELLQKFKYPVQILRYPFASTLVVTLTLFQFFMSQPPFIISGILWAIIGFALIFLFRETTTVYYQRFWIIMYIFTLVAICLQAIILKSAIESWFILLVGIAAIAFGVYSYIHRHRWDSSLLLWIIVLMIVLEFIAIGFLLFGNYNVSKMFMTLGIYNILIAVSLLSTFHIINDMALFSGYISDTEDEKKISFTSMQLYSINKGYTVLFFIAWLVLVNRNSYWYQTLLKPFEDSYSKERSIGDFTFTFESVTIFFAVIVIATFLSKIVSFLASDKQRNHSNGKPNKIGSWLLLIRILIITIGILIAFTSAGIPMDRFTIIISALGVGIGFGLQTLVNNLVSGVIIAFEKPVNLDDIVEVGGQTGQMKSIGIRSSVVTTYDGAEVIIPNGDLLSQHLTNWTMGSAKRRYEISVGVAYGTDLKIAQQVILKVVQAHVLVLKNPEPMVWFTNFNESSIGIAVKYWVPHFNYGNDVKSDLIMGIDVALKENNIVIPFPQQDLHIHTTSKGLEDIAKEDE
jgi:small-conductance mechanosensitive channel